MNWIRKNIPQDSIAYVKQTNHLSGETQKAINQ
jgi:hypothetical protein